MTLNEDYPEVWSDIHHERIPKSDADKYFLNLLLKIIEDVKQGKRDELDIGDIFPLAILNAFSAKGYKFRPEVDDFFCELGNYKSHPFDCNHPQDTPKIVEKRARELLRGLRSFPKHQKEQATTGN